MRRSCILVILTLGLISMSGQVWAQSTSNSFPWPANPNVGIGTQLSTGGIQNALQIHYNSADGFSKPPIIRLSVGTYDTTHDYGILGVMPTLYDTTYSTSFLTRGYDLIFHDHQDGDIIITNNSPWSLSHALGGAIRLATTGDTTQRPATPRTQHDLERETILGNGNIGFDLPPNDTTGLGTPLEQIQIGGGTVPPPGYTTPVPGLTIYGGNRFEGMALPVGYSGLYPYAFRTIHFNTYGNHLTNAGSRIAPLSSCGLDFSDIGGGTLQLNCWPYDSAEATSVAMTDFTHELTMQVNGNGGMFLWYYQDSTHPYHHIFDAFLPGVITWPVTRNTNGLFFHHTPVYIGSDSTSTPSADFQNLPVHPRLGDGQTWMLAVNGSALAKEFYVSLDWPDFVFDPSYKLAPLDDIENYIEANHHLPGIPSAKDMDTTGVPLGKTEAALTQKVEELTLYTIELNKKLNALESEIQELKNDKTK